MRERRIAGYRCESNLSASVRLWNTNRRSVIRMLDCRRIGVQTGGSCALDGSALREVDYGRCHQATSATTKRPEAMRGYVAVVGQGSLSG
ncbi:hypothetical protein [Burkholderia ubonensis]|uniref:hypothetical protein n=1 Tax=Burkholderia ubonensis TaxID=101571 RepID=UPI0012FA4A17|nr:hypothetical protein [Burkholderia ubonensis]